VDGGWFGAGLLFVGLAPSALPGGGGWTGGSELVARDACGHAWGPAARPARGPTGWGAGTFPIAVGRGDGGGGGEGLEGVEGGGIGIDGELHVGLLGLLAVGVLGRGGSGCGQPCEGVSGQAWLLEAGDEGIRRGQGEGVGIMGDRVAVHGGGLGELELVVELMGKRGRFVGIVVCFWVLGGVWNGHYIGCDDSGRSVVVAGVLMLVDLI